MKKLSVNDLHKSLKKSLGDEFNMNELDFANELSVNEGYRDLVLNQIFPAIDSEFTPDLADEITRDLKKKDSQIGSTLDYGESGVITSVDGEPGDPKKDKKKRRLFFRWQNEPNLGASSYPELAERKKKLEQTNLQYDVFVTNFIDNTPEYLGMEIGGNVIDQFEMVYGTQETPFDYFMNTETGELITDRDDRVARAVMEQKAIMKGLNWVEVYRQTEFPNGIPDEVNKAVNLTRIVNERSFMISMHEDITEYIQNPSRAKLSVLNAKTGTQGEEELNEWYEKNAEAILEFDDIFQIQIDQPLPEVKIYESGKEPEQDMSTYRDVGFSGNFSDALAYIESVSNSDAWQTYMKYQKSRDYFYNALDNLAEAYPDYAQKISAELKTQQLSDNLSRTLDGYSVVGDLGRGSRPVVRTGLTIFHGLFELPKTIHKLFGGKAPEDYDDFLDVIDPDNNRFTLSGSDAQRIGFEYQMDLGDGYVAVYDAAIEDGGDLAYILRPDGYKVLDPMLSGRLSEMANQKVANGEKLDFNFDTYSTASQSFQALLDVLGMITGGEAAAASKVLTGGAKTSMRLSNWIRKGAGFEGRIISTQRAATKARTLGSTSTMYLEMHHGIYNEAIMNGMTSREAEYYAVGSSMAISLVNRLNPEFNFLKEFRSQFTGGVNKEFFKKNMIAGLTNRELVKAGFRETIKTFPKAAVYEGMEERFLEPLAQEGVGQVMQLSTSKKLQLPDLEIISKKGMQEFLVGALVGGKMNVLTNAKAYSNMSRVHQEMYYKAYNNQEEAFATLTESVGSVVYDVDGNAIPVTEEMVQETIDYLQSVYTKFDDFVEKAELENNAFYTDEHKMAIMQEIALNEALVNSELEESEKQKLSEQFENKLNAYAKNTNVIDADYTSTRHDLYRAAKESTALRELDSDVANLMGKRDTDTRPEHIKALAKVLEGNFEKVPVFVDMDAFRAFAVGIGIEPSKINDYRGVYDSVHNAILINPETATLGTPIHEYSHVWINYVAKHNPDLYNKMKALVEQSPELMGAVGQDAFYQGKEAMEAMAIAIEKRAEEVVSDPDLLAKLKNAVKEFFAYLAKAFNVRTDDFSNMTLQEFVDQGAYEVLTGDFKLGGTIETLPAQNTTLHSNLGNIVSTLTTQGRVEGTLIQNDKGEFLVESPQGNVVVGRRDQASVAIGDLGVIRTDLEGRVKLVPATKADGTGTRLVEIDGRMHVVSDESMAKDSQGRSYGLVLQDKETGQEVFFSVDNEITQEIMRKAVAGKYFSKTPESSEIFQIGIAPFRNRPVSTNEEFKEALDTPQFKFFENTLDDIASELNIETIESFPALGGYEFANGQYVNEISRVMQLQGRRDDIELLSAVMGILAPEQQESVMMLEIGDSIHNVDVDFDPQLGFHVIPESVWSESFDSRRLFMLEMLRQDFESATGITGKTLNEEAELFEDKYGYRPYFLDVTEDGQFVMAFPYSVASMLDLLRKDGITRGGYPFISRGAIDAAFENGFDNIPNQAVELLSTINSVFSRIYNMGLPATFELNLGLSQSPELGMDDVFTQVKEISSALEYVAKKTIGTSAEVINAFGHVVQEIREGEEAFFNGDGRILFNQQGRSNQGRNFHKPLGLIIQMESTELQGVDKVKYITDFARSMGIKGYSFDPNTDRLHIFVNNNNEVYTMLSKMETRWDVSEINYARVKPRFKSERSTREDAEAVRSSVERGYYETIRAYRSKRPNLANERPNLHNALSVAEEAYVRDEAHRSDNRSMINAPVKIEWNDAKSDYMIGGMTMQQYGFRYGLTDFGGVRPRKSIGVGGGVTWEIPGGIDLGDTFTYAELIWMKEQGWNPNDIKDEFVRTMLYRKLARTHTQRDIERGFDLPKGMTLEQYVDENSDAANEVVSLDQADTFNRYIFGMLSPNQPLTPNEMQVAAMRVQGVEDKDSDEAIRKWFGGEMIGPLDSHGLPGELYAEGYTYNISSISFSRLTNLDRLFIGYTIKHHVSDGSIHTQLHKEPIPFDALSHTFIDSDGNRAIEADRLKAYIADDLAIDEVFPSGYPFRGLEEEAELRWAEVAEGVRLYVGTSTATRTEAEDDLYNSFVEFADQYPWVSKIVDGIYSSYSEMTGAFVSREEKRRVLDGYIQNVKNDFVRGWVVTQYLSELTLSADSVFDRYEKMLGRSVLNAAQNEQGRLNNKAVDPIFREDAGRVRSRLYMGVANLAKDGDFTGTLRDGTKIEPGTRVFFHGTRFFFDKLDRVQEAKGAGSDKWNKTMKPARGFTPFVTPSWSLANGFKGIGGEVLSIAVDADTKVFDPSRMGNVFGNFVRGDGSSSAHEAFGQGLFADIESIARGEKTNLPQSVVGSAIIYAYTSANSLEQFFRTYFLNEYQENLLENQSGYVEFGYGEGVPNRLMTPKFFESLLEDTNFLRKLAADLLFEDFTHNDMMDGVSRIGVESESYQYTNTFEDSNTVDYVGMEIDVYSLPGMLFAKKSVDYAMENLDADFKELIERYQKGGIPFAEDSPSINYVNWTQRRDNNVTPVTETLNLLFKFADNDFRLIEQPSIVDFFEEKGFDAFVVREQPYSVANLAVINPDKVNLKYNRDAPGIPRVRNSFTAQDVEKVTIQGLANMYPKDASESLTAEERKELNTKMKMFFNMQKMDEGGLGLAGSADLTNVARFAKMYMDNPSFFMKKKVETWVDFLERVQNQVPGLSSKTGSFAIVWQDPGVAAISAMDRHMFRIFEKDLFSDKEKKAEFERMVVQRWNGQVDKADAIKDPEEKAKHYRNKATMVRPGAKKADNLDDVMAQYDFGKVGAIYMETGFSMLSNNPVKFRYKSGEVNPTISVNLQGTNFIVEPDKVQSISENYMRMLAINEEKARQSGLSVFMSQWALWDKARNRFEPHAMMFPGLHKLPRMSFSNLKKARAGHRDVGYFNSSKVEKFNEELGELTQTMKPVQKAEPGSLLYFSSDPYRGLDMAQAKEIVMKYKEEGMTPDMIREAFVRGGMDSNVADALIDVEFNPQDPTIPEKLRLGFMNFSGRLSTETSDEITENAQKYIPRSNQITSADAYLMMEQMGVEAVYDLLNNPTAMADERLKINGIKFSDSEVRVVLTRLVAEQFDKIANQMTVAGEEELSKEYRAYAAQVMDILLPELTQKGRFIQAASILARSSSNYYVQNVNNRLRTKGFGPLSDENSEAIRRLHAKMRNAPEGLPKVEAEHELMRYLSEVLPVSLYEVLENQYYTNLLSGYGTNLKNAYGSFNQILFEGMTEAFASRSIRDMGAFFMGVFKGMVPAANIFRYVMATGIQYGYQRAGKYDDRKVTQGLPLYEYMSPSKFRSGLLQSKNPLAKFMGHISTGVGRAMLTIFNPKVMKYFGRTLIGTDVAFAAMAQSAQMELIKQRLKREHKFSPKDLDAKAKELLFGRDIEREGRYQGYQTRAENEGYRRGTPAFRIRVMELARSEEVSEQMQRHMHRKGQEYTYNYDPEGILGFGYAAMISIIERAQNANPTLGYIAQGTKTLFVPFARILVNVANRGYAYSPLGFLKQSAGITTKFFGKKARKMEAGSMKWVEVNDYEKSLARARATIGTLVTVSLYALTMGDDDDEENLPWLTITGAGPSDYNKRYQLGQNNVYKPFTITINRSLLTGEVLPQSERTRFDYKDNMLFLTLAAVGTIRDQERFGDNSEAQNNRALSTATTYITSMLSSMSEQSYIQGLAGLFKEVQASGSAGGEKNLETATEGLMKKVENYGINTISGLLVPNIVKQVTRTGRSLSNRAIQQKIGSIENPSGYLNDIFRDMHMIEPDYPILDHFGRPVSGSYDNYIPMLVQASEEEKGVYRFFRENYLDKNMFIPRHKFPEFINERGEVEPMTKEEELGYFALRNAFIFEGLDKLRFDPVFDDIKYNSDTGDIEDEYPFASEERVDALASQQMDKDMKAELSRVVSEANDKAERYIEAMKFDLPFPDDFELPDYILDDAPYRDELFPHLK